MRSVKYVCQYLLCLVILLSMVGCGPPKGSKALAVEVRLKGSVHDRLVKVDLICVNVSEKESWDALDLGGYWGGKRAQHAKDHEIHQMVFNAGGDIQAKVDTLPVGDPIWKELTRNTKSRYYLVVLADVGGVPHERAPGNANPMRHIESLEKSRWPRISTIKFEIGRTGVDLLTPPQKTED